MLQHADLLIERSSGQSDFCHVWGSYERVMRNVPLGEHSLVQNHFGQLTDPVKYHQLPVVWQGSCKIDRHLEVGGRSFISLMEVSVVPVRIQPRGAISDMINKRSNGRHDK